MVRKLIISAFVLFMLIPAYSYGQEKKRDRLREPISKEEIEKYSHIQFDISNFEKVVRGMTEEQVLELLGKPLKVKMEKRRRNRWTVHFFYPEGHVVNFKNGLVVGKD